MFVRQFKEYVGKRSIFLFSKHYIKIAFSRHLRTFAMKNLSPDPTMAGPAVDFGYEGIFNSFCKFCLKG